MIATAASWHSSPGMGEPSIATDSRRFRLLLATAAVTGAALVAPGCSQPAVPYGGCCGWAVPIEVACQAADGGGCPASAGCPEWALWSPRSPCAATLKGEIECNVASVCCQERSDGHLWCADRDGGPDSKDQAVAQDAADRIRAFLQTSQPQVVSPDSPRAECDCFVN